MERRRAIRGRRSAGCFSLGSGEFRGGREKMGKRRGEGGKKRPRDGFSSTTEWRRGSGGGDERRERSDVAAATRVLIQTLNTADSTHAWEGCRSSSSSYHMNGSWATTITTSIFLLAALTDWLDGYLARKMQLGTRFGAFLDPVADKLMVAASLVLLCTEPLEVAIFGEVSWVLTVPAIAITGREITMSAVREWAATQSSKVLEAVAVNNLGKWKTATQMVALTILLVTRDPRARLSSFDRRSSPVSFGRSCSMVISSVHEKNMEIPGKVIHTCLFSRY